MKECVRNHKTISASCASVLKDGKVNTQYLLFFCVFICVQTLTWHHLLIEPVSFFFSHRLSVVLFCHATHTYLLCATIKRGAEIYFILHSTPFSKAKHVRWTSKSVRRIPVAMVQPARTPWEVTAVAANQASPDATAKPTLTTASPVRLQRPPPPHPTPLFPLFS